MPQIEVTFDIDANGILNVTARDKATSKEQKITITGSTGLSKDEVEKMTKEAAAHAEEDRKKKEEIEVKNQADALTYTAERTIKDAGDKMPAETKTDLENKIKETREAIQKGDLNDIKQKQESLSSALQAFGSTMYGQQTEAKQQEPDVNPQTEVPGEEGQKNGEAVEGEVVDDDNKKE